MVFFFSRFHAFFICHFFSFARPLLSPNFLVERWIVLIKNSPQNAHSIQTLFCFYRTMFILRIACLHSIIIIHHMYINRKRNHTHITSLLKLNPNVHRHTHTTIKRRVCIIIMLFLYVSLCILTLACKKSSSFLIDGITVCTGWFSLWWVWRVGVDGCFCCCCSFCL